MKERWNWAELLSSEPSAGSGQEVDQFGSAFQRLFDVCPVGLFVLDHQGRFIRTNQEFRRIVQYEASSLVNCHFQELVAEEDSERLADYHVRRLLGDPALPHTFEVLLTTRLGQKRVVELHGNIMPLSDGFLGAARDITMERVLSDPLIQDHHAESLAALAGGVANEFNNLLAVILGYAQMIRSRSEGNSGVEIPADAILEACGRAIEHVRSILTFARHGSHALQVVDLSDLLRSLSALLPGLGSGTCRITLSGLDEPLRVRGDAARLEQVVLNLLTNSAEAIGPTGGVISIVASSATVRAGDKAGLGPGCYSVVEFRDTGPGVAPEDTARVFQPFFTTRSNSGHTGLGLPVAQGIVRDHGGLLEFDQAVSPGACFRLWLPQERDSGQLVPVARLTGSEARKRTVLVIDDEVMVADLFRYVLEAEGFIVTVSNDPREALQELKRSSTLPDLLIVDLMMPDMDGRTLVRQITEAGIRLPVVVTSGYSIPHHGDEALSAQVHGFLRKPFSNSDVITMVRSVLVSSHK